MQSRPQRFWVIQPVLSYDADAAFYDFGTFPYDLASALSGGCGKARMIGAWRVRLFWLRLICE